MKTSDRGTTEAAEAGGGVLGGEKSLSSRVGQFRARELRLLFSHTLPPTPEVKGACSFGFRAFRLGRKQGVRAPDRPGLCVLMIK